MLLLQRNIVAVVPLFDPDTSAGGIIIPEQAKGRCTQGIVKYLGPKCKNVKIADHVLFSAYSGTTIQVEGEGSVLIFIPESGIEAIIESPATNIPGLYFKSHGGSGVIENEYFVATYEQVMTMIAKAINEQPEVMKSLAAHFRKHFTERSERPPLSSYNVEADDAED